MSTERKDARVLSVPARGVAAYLRAPQEVQSVADANAAAEALRDPDNLHVCPLCKEPLRTAEFKAHAPGCIKARAGILERQRDEPLPGRPGKRVVSMGHWKRQR